MKIKYQDLNVGEEFEVEFDGKTYKCMKLANIDTFTYIDGDRKGWTCTIAGRKLVEVDRTMTFSELNVLQKFKPIDEDYDSIYVKIYEVTGKQGKWNQMFNTLTIKSDNPADGFEAGTLTQTSNDSKVELVE